MQKDLLVVDVVDSYANLTQKLVSGLRWIKEACPEAEWIARVDSDMILSWSLARPGPPTALQLRLAGATFWLLWRTLRRGACP